MTQANRLPQPGLKPKDLMMIPARAALALQEDGWWLRMDNVWAKANPMPESVEDRPTKAHEYVFLFAKSERYHYDHEAIFEPFVSTHPSGNDFVRGERLSYQNPDGTPRGNRNQWTPPSHRGSSFTKGKTAATKPASGHGAPGQGPREDHAGRNHRSVWNINTVPFPGAHFAVMPEELAETCILAGAPRGGLVLDPFCGSGTVGVVSLRHGRQFIGIELNSKYVRMAHRRILRAVPLVAADPGIDIDEPHTDLPLFSPEATL